MANYAGSNAADIYTGTSDDDTINGNGGDDTLSGADGNDIIDGGDGNDVLAGNSGNDELQGGLGDDFIDGGDGNDTLKGGEGGNDTFVGGDGDDLIVVEDVVLTRNSGSGIYLSANYSFTNSVNAGAGNDVVLATIGVLHADLGVGDDTIAVQSSRGSVDGGSGLDSFSLDYSFEGAASTGVPNSLTEFPKSPNISINLAALWSGGTGTVSTSASDMTMSLVGLERLTSITTSEGNDSVVVGGAYTYDVGVFLNPSVYTVGISTGEGSDTVVGGSGRDVIDAGAGNDVLDGAGGADVLFGRSGDDLYIIDNIADMISEADGSGLDTVLTSVSFALPADVERIFAADPDGIVPISLKGNALSNEIGGNSGPNLIDGGAGADLMVGGAGDDTYFVDNLGDQAIESAGGGKDTVSTSVSFALGHDLERLVASDLRGTTALSLTGNELANELIGNDGANVIDGRAGADVMTGNGGNDVYFVDNAGDLINESVDGGFDTIFTSVNHTLGANVERGVISGAAGLISLYGNDLDNELSGDDAGNILNGGIGADIMTGYGGDDYYIVDNPGDQAIELPDGGYDTVFANADFTLNHDMERVVAFDLRSTNAMNFTGNELANELVGNDGTNVLDGKAGADVMTGYAGNDVYFVDNAGDLVNESANGGYDTVFTSINYLLGSATGGNIERLAVADRAAAQGLSLRGNDLDNEISGDDGNNIIEGGLGHDILIGYGGSDSFVFASALGAANADHVADFDPSADRIALDHSIFTGLASGHLDSSAFAVGTAAQDADDRVIYDPASGTLYFDPDGTGSMQAQVFATVHDGLALTAENFVVI